MSIVILVASFIAAKGWRDNPRPQRRTWSHRTVRELAACVAVIDVLLILGATAMLIVRGVIGG